MDSQGHIVRDEKRFTVTGTPDLHLTTFDGAIEIRSGEGREVVVEIEKRGPTQESVERLQVTATQDGNRIDVEVKKPAGDSVFFGIGHNMSPSAKFVVTMPKDGNVAAKSGDGSIRIEHVSGRLELRTGDGSIRGTDVSGQLAINTGRRIGHAGRGGRRPRGRNRRRRRQHRRQARSRPGAHRRWLGDVPRGCRAAR